jgi:outer membrane protein OmpA-like peptidoglycan-associated protein
MRTKLFFLFTLLLSIMVLSSCCPSSRVILLDSGKSASAIIVKTDNGELILDKPNTYTIISNPAEKPATARTISPQELEKEFGGLIESAPRAPRSFILYFQANSIMLTEESKKQFPEIEQAIRLRIPCDVSIIGHTDRLGSKEYNINLSLKRARFVYDWLKQKNIDTMNFVIESYGEEDPLIPTPDGVADPRNRRVEILIR